jgi:hypothetical protein
METLLRAFRRFSRGQKLAVVAILLVIVATWLAVCFVLGSYFAP